MSKRKNWVGIRVGLLVITKRACKKKYGEKMWHTRCVCGKHTVVAVNNLNAALRRIETDPRTIRACGDPAHRSGRAHRQFIHGGNHVHRREYHTWLGMNQRCRNPKNPAYPNYGGRGITVCARWTEKGTGFLNFFADLGPRPEGMSLDRENVMGNYEPGNCRWADQETQNANRRCNYTPEQLAEFQREADETAAPDDVF